jgi:hypothetical protein
MTKPENQQRVIKSIAIIGGGASGAIILDSLVKEQKFDKIKLFERRGKLGGVWVLDKNPSTLNVPPGLTELQLDPEVSTPSELEEPETAKDFVLKPRSNQERYIHTASYEDLRTNIPEQLMTYSDEKTWGIPLNDKRRVEDVYVRGEVIQQYIERYLNRNPEYIQYRTTVEHLAKDYNDPNSQFELTLREETDEKNEDNEPLDKWYKEKFDAVVVATGHYHVPYIPDVPGLSEVYHRFPHKVKHSKTFRANDDFKDKTVIVIGTRASGADIVQIATKSAKQVYQSKRSKDAALRLDATEGHIVLPKIVRYELINDRDIIVHFEDGQTVKNPDEIIYATGFRYSYPFLRKQFPNFTTGYIIPDLYLHTFFNKDPLLSIVGVPTDAISFRAFEFQSVLISRFLASKIELPDLQTQLEWGLSRFQNKGDTRAYHTIDFESKFEFLESLVEIGGGVNPIGGTGRPFPVFTDDDRALQQKILERFRKFFSEHEKAQPDGVTVPE